jgi:DNA replication and repair protein RecF
MREGVTSMLVSDLALEDFRNYEKERVSFADGINLVLGANAQGKTNLLEAVHCVSGLGSPRAPDAALIREGAESGLLHGRALRAGRDMQVDMEMRSGRGTRLLINKSPTTRARSLAQLPVSVFFGPDELSLVKGSPEGRRRFIDDLVAKLRPARDALRRELEKVLRQRNALLKTLRRGGEAASTAELEPWDQALQRTGAQLVTARLHALGALLPFAAKRYEEIAGGGRLEVSYSSSYLPADAAVAGISDPSTIDEDAISALLGARIEELRVAELERGLTLVGPQRDDLTVQLVSAEGSLMEARSFASQGDQRTSALALKLGEHDLLSDFLGESPLLLLDDVFSELDPNRRRWLSGAVRSGGQVLISSADPVSAAEAEPDRVVVVDSGRLRVDG